MIVKVVKNAAIFLILFTMILTLNLGNLKTGFVLISFAQETPTSEETVGVEETEEEAAAEEAEEELDISLIAEYIRGRI